MTVFCLLNRFLLCIKDTGTSLAFGCAHILLVEIHVLATNDDYWATAKLTVDEIFDIMVETFETDPSKVPLIIHFRIISKRHLMFL